MPSTKIDTRTARSRLFVGGLTSAEWACAGSSRAAGVRAQFTVCRHELIGQARILVHILAEQLGAAGAPLGDLVGGELADLHALLACKRVGTGFYFGDPLAGLPLHCLCYLRDEGLVVRGQ